MVDVLDVLLVMMLRPTILLCRAAGTRLIWGNLCTSFARLAMLSTHVPSRPAVADDIDESLGGNAAG